MSHGVESSLLFGLSTVTLIGVIEKKGWKLISYLRRVFIIINNMPRCPYATLHNK